MVRFIVRDVRGGSDLMTGADRREVLKGTSSPRRFVRCVCRMIIAFLPLDVKIEIYILRSKRISTH